MLINNLMIYRIKSVKMFYKPEIHAYLKILDKSLLYDLMHQKEK